ncbi:MAG: transglutaminase family protein [Rhodocyclales bacterium]|nr:transglutaminase family protein [Rhodocyclales bacterium]
MSIHVALKHVTSYRYDRLVHLSPQVIRLRPCPHTRTRILSYSQKITPEHHFINWLQDPQSNWQARVVFPEPTREFIVEVDLVAEIAVINPFDFFLEPYAEEIPFAYEAWQRHELTPFLYRRGEPDCGPLFRSYLESIPRTPTPTVSFLVDLNRRVQRDIAYMIRLEPGVQTPEETLTLASGSCRDSAWLMVQLLRHLGLAARFVSGYLIQLKPDVKSLDGPSGPEEDFTDLHAWCEVYLPGAGWVGLDPTSGLFAGEGHLPLACTPEPSSAAPITGLVDPCEVEFDHTMTITRILEAPRVTKPYTEEQWSRIEEVAWEIDAKLERLDVRLTMGGEPTFVSLDDPDGEEWNTAAMGPTKRRYADRLMRELKSHYAPQGLIHLGQGKWYPGEQLPRWSLNCFWRSDGEPMWVDPALLADEETTYGVGEADAQRFLIEVARRLGLDPRHVFPGYEDTLYYLWRERRLPVNVTPFDAHLDDPLERERLRRLFTQGLSMPTGYVLPVRKDPEAGAWRTGPWFLREERCYLIPGDSPMGYRLPLDSLPWVAPLDYPYIHPLDPANPFPPLPSHTTLRHQWESAKPAGPVDTTPPKPFASAANVVRLAMCAEPREGRLYIFMPPTATMEEYLELLAVVEATAAQLNLPVVIEGYEPPLDPRLSHFRITPDPGVLEVNIHPARNWAELVEHTTFLYEAAHRCRLTTEKFMLDGRHTGTGGGNHFVLGGPMPLESPFLRRPDLLRSLVAYWINHPSLSYLFSGLFIGPTSQAPRVDEARNDSLYELEIAFRQIPEPGGEVPPWLVDRIFRNLLIDVSGNTHRAEFCIDKLYAPEGPAGRRGLLELRAFEMPPHARMSLTQQLLLRALIARFWNEPYRPTRLVRWGTELHDRFMLPRFVEYDFRDVLSELQQAGFPLEFSWFAPHFEFRFPKYGDLAVGGIELELRQALEPWHVMGEEGTIGGTARYVDSSVERLQVLITGMAPERYVLTCNGIAVPLQPTGRRGEFVAGVRYRAWQPASCLHPLIGVHSPLTFDLVDTWMQRSIAGCQYHVAHPGGRNFQTLPVNAFEAESRRLARFFRMGHTPGQMRVSPPVRDAEHPFTLDLRQHLWS